MQGFNIRHYLLWIRTGLTLVIAFAFLWFAVLPVAKGYDYFIQYAVDLLHHQKNEAFIREKFHAEQFGRLRIFLLITGLLLTAGIALIHIKGKATDEFLGKIVAHFPGPAGFFAFWQTMPRINRLLLVVLILVFFIQSFYFAYTRPITGDEAYTYLSFINNGPLVSAVFYPYPNNHVLFSVLAYPISLLPIPLSLQIRLPALLFSLLSILALYRLLANYFSSTIALAACGMFAFLYPFFLYSHLARGYSLYLLCGILSLHCLLKAMSQTRKRHWYFFVIFSVAGLYTIPSYLYGFLGMTIPAAIYLLFKKNDRLVSFIVSCSAVAALSFLLYVPIILLCGGWKSFLQILFIDFEEKLLVNRETLGIAFKTHYAFQFAGNILIAGVFIIVSTVLSIVIFLKKRLTGNNKLLLLFAIFNMLVPVGILLVQHKIPFGRTTILLSAYFAILLALLFNYFIAKPATKYLMILPAATMMLMNMSVGWKLKPSNAVISKVEENSKPMADIMMAQHVHSCFNTDEPTYNITIATYYAAMDQAIQIDIAPADSVLAVNQLIQKNYDSYIIRREDLKRTGFESGRYKLAYENEGLLLLIK